MKKCNCELCERSQKFFQIIEKLPPDEKDWMETFYNGVMDTEGELEMLQVYQDLETKA